MIATNSSSIINHINALKSDDKERRINAAEALARMGSKRVVHNLIPLLSDREWIIRKIAADGLARIGSPCYEEVRSLIFAAHPDTRFWSIKVLERLGEIAAPDLIQCLRNQFDESRRFAATALGNMRFPVAITPLTNALADPAYLVRTAAADALVKFGNQALPMLDVALRNSQSDIRFWAIRCTGRILGSQNTIQSLAPLLNDPSPEKRTIGVIALGETRDPAATPMLIERFNDPSLRIRREASEAIQLFSAAAIGPLKQALNHPNEDVRQWVAETMGSVVKKLGRNVIGTLSKLTQGAGPELQAVSISALGQTHSSEAVGSIIPCLGSPYLSIRRVASDSLINLGYRSIPALKALLESPHEIMAHQAAKTLGKLLDLVDSRAVDLFADMLAHPAQKEMAVVALGETGNVNAIPHLMSLLTDKRWSIRRAAATALAGFGEKTVKELRAGLNSPNDELQHWCTIAFAEMCPRVGGGALQSLVYVLNTAEKPRKLLAVSGLEGLTERSAVNALVEHLGDDHWPVRQACSNALVSIGRDAEDSLRAAMLSSDNKDVRFWARKTIELIKKDNE